MSSSSSARRDGANLTSQPAPPGPWSHGNAPAVQDLEQVLQGCLEEPEFLSLSVEHRAQEQEKIAAAFLRRFYDPKKTRSFSFIALSLLERLQRMGLLSRSAFAASRGPTLSVLFAQEPDHDTSSTEAPQDNEPSPAKTTTTNRKRPRATTFPSDMLVQLVPAKRVRQKKDGTPTQCTRQGYCQQCRKKSTLVCSACIAVGKKEIHAYFCSPRNAGRTCFEQHALEEHFEDASSADE